MTSTYKARSLVNDRNIEKWHGVSTFLRVLSYVSAFASLVGISLLGVLARLSGDIKDPWQISTGVTIAVLLPLAALAARGFTTRQVLRAVHVEELHGRQAVTERERDLIGSAVGSVAYVAGDFSHIRDIHNQLLQAYNRNVTVRVLAANSTAPAVRANLAQAIALHCQVRVYDRDFRRIKALIIDANEADEGTVMFVKKTQRGSQHDERGHGVPGDDQSHNYLGTIYTDRLLVTAVGQMFDAWWQKAQPFTT